MRGGWLSETLCEIESLTPQGRIEYAGAFFAGQRQVHIRQNLAVETHLLGWEYGAYKTAKAIFWPWLSGESP